MDNEKIILEYLSSLRLKGCSINTINGYKLDLNQFFKAIGKTYDNIDFREVNSYFRLMVDNKAVKTIARKMASVKSFYKWLLDEEYLSEDPTRKLKSPKMPKKMPKFLTHDEVTQVISADSNLRNRTVMTFLYSSGARIDELYKLNKEDIDWDKRQVKVTGKGSKDRIIPFNKETKEMLIEYLATRDDDNPALFVEQGGLRLSKRTIQKFVRNNGKKAGIKKPVTPHKFRHSFCTRLLSEGVALEEIQSLVGHESVSTTQIYAFTNNQKVRTSYDSVFDKD